MYDVHIYDGESVGLAAQVAQAIAAVPRDMLVSIAYSFSMSVSSATYVSDRQEAAAAACMVVAEKGAGLLSPAAATKALRGY
jgi:hypothetical protein